MAEALLFEHEDGRYAVNPDTTGDPKWHRVGPVDVSALSTSLPSALREVHALTAEIIATEVCREVAELSDRGNPEDWPEAMLVTADELRSIVLAALSTNAGEAAEAQSPIELRGVAETLAGQGGDWRSCSGCHELNEGHDTGPYSAVLKCHLGNGCSECGGIGAIWDTTNYAGMAAHALQAAAVHGQSASTESIYVECRECSNCGHIGLNDDAEGMAACNTCEWNGPSPKEDHCPGCGRDGTMTGSCPECGCRTTLLAGERISPPAAIPAPGDFPARIMALLHTVADRNPPEGFGVYEDDKGEPMQDDADAAIAWIEARALVQPAPSKLSLRGLTAKEISTDFTVNDVAQPAPVQHNPELLLGWKRYEKLRKVSPAVFTRLHIANTSGGGAFDDLVDKLPEPSTPVPEAAPVQQEAAGDAQYQAWEENATLACLPVRSDANAAADCAQPAPVQQATAKPVLCVSSKEFKRMRAGDHSIRAWLPPATYAEDMLLYAAPVQQEAPITATMMVDDSGETPVYCVMAAYRSKSTADAALAALQPTQGAKGGA